MADLVPTRATAMLGVKGEFLYAFAGVKYEPGKEAEGYATCLILPAPRPIKQCPEEWKDGRWVWIWVEKDPHSSWCSFRWDDDNWIDPNSELIDWYVTWGGTPTHIMLPATSPEEAPR